MNIRHLATKGFDEDITTRRSLVYNGVPITVSSTDIKSDGSREQIVEFNSSYPDSVNVISSLEAGKEELENSPLGGIIFDKNSSVLPLSSISAFEVKPDSDYSEFLPVGATFNNLFEADMIQEFLRDTAITLFPNSSPITGGNDINHDSFYTPYIPLAVLSGCIPPQVKDDNAFFNPDGVVTVAEFLDGLNSINYGANSNRVRKRTLDNISNETDYFNEGYQKCLRGLSSPFFNLYTREELMKPITRLELAYITVICWEQFIAKFNNLYGGTFYLGISFDWEVPGTVLGNYTDSYDYKISKYSIDEDYDIISLNVAYYKSDRTMTEYKEDIKSGVAPIPLPMFMSMLELGVLGLYHYEDNMLNPLKEVSRGELAYFLTKLALLFPTIYNK